MSNDFRLGGDLVINRLGFGAMRLPSQQGMGGPARDPENGRAVLRRAVELGVNHIDTADFYVSAGGVVRANTLIHEALRPYPSDLVIATKVGPIIGSGGLHHAIAADMRGLVEANLEGLGVDRLDVVYLRIGAMEPPRGESLAERFEALAALREEGLIRHLGLSNVDTGHLAEARAIAPVVAVQNHAAQSDEADLLAASAPRFTETVGLDLCTVVPSLAGPSRPEDRVPLDQAKSRFRTALASIRQQGEGGDGRTSSTATVVIDGTAHELSDGAVAVAAITSCTNTSNPAVMVAAGLLARNAVRAGLRSKPWVKTTLSPGSRVVMDYYRRAGLIPDLEALGFHLAGFGCMTCIGASGPLIGAVSQAGADTGLTVTSVLSGNRNFEGRIQPDVAMNYLASPPLVIAYALTGTMDIDLRTEPLGHDQQGGPVHLHDIWPDPAEIEAVMAASIDAAMFTDAYGHVFAGDSRWQDISVPATESFAWDEDSTYIRRPPTSTT
ncbi:aldo/keto reductase [Streptomyces sp. MB09-02B]|uniref:aldo/keto reductase n=1 Tax=Streptomyces sp. MB09-02B TaxID=3028667 RepID=UPI0029A2298B|nr:aldo/keto reductase [Streptomyces sp. MB09-02B]MDX3640831.1 aldo/keto reductase [Streptomyces sp. MB09-02B]